jgi:hypothetical protein
MTRERFDGLIFLFLGGLLFLALGYLQEVSVPIRTSDFKPLYYSARTLIEHRDPYNAAEVLRVFRAEGGDSPAYTELDRSVATVDLYLPSAFAISLPLAMLCWAQAQALWILLMAASNLLAALLIWQAGARHAPLLSGVLTGFWLANNELLFITGNPGGLAVGLCIIAVCCILEDRLPLAGIACLALSLALKPQDAALVWLGLLLAGGVYRKRAWQTLAAVGALAPPALVCTLLVSPHWLQEFLASYRAFSAPGGINDPGAGSPGAYGIAVITSLQRVVSFFCHAPGVYNPICFLLYAPMLAAWAVLAHKKRPTLEAVWLSLAAAAALAMVSTYHRQYDAKLLLLAVPPCAMLWAGKGRFKNAALAVTAFAIFLNGDLPWEVYQAWVRQIHPPMAGFWGGLALMGMFFPVPLMLLTSGFFYLRVAAQSGKQAP